MIEKNRQRAKFSVFCHPENEKGLILEQHVTLSDNQAGKFEKERDGKKICWNFRKGRCYKGHNCPLFHDGDLKATAVAEKNIDQHVRFV